MYKISIYGCTMFKKLVCQWFNAQESRTNGGYSDIFIPFDLCLIMHEMYSEYPPLRCFTYLFDVHVTTGQTAMDRPSSTLRSVSNDNRQVASFSPHRECKIVSLHSLWKADEYLIFTARITVRTFRIINWSDFFFLSKKLHFTTAFRMTSLTIKCVSAVFPKPETTLAAE